MASKSLVNQVRFVHMADQMKPKEFHKFLSIVTQTCGRAFILTALFNYFKSIDDDQLNKVVDSASDILRSRKQKGEKKVDKQSMSALDNDMIGSIASYLNQTEYARFSISCRAILISCNSPNTLRKMDLLSKITYPAIKPDCFPGLKSLAMVSSKISSLTNGNRSTHNMNLEHLQLNGLFDEDSWDEFMTQNLGEIKHFGFNVAHRHGETRTPGNYFDLLAKFKNISHLELNDEFTLDDIPNDSQFKQLFPNFIAFTSSNGACLANRIINLYSDQLKSLSFKDTNDITVSAEASFQKLEELKVTAVSHCTLLKILLNARKLRKVRISWSEDSTPSCIKDATQSIVATQCSLQYLETVSKCYTFAPVFDAIERGLFVRKQEQQKREYFKAKVLIDCEQKKVNLQDIMINLSRLKNVFVSSGIADFMVLCSMNGKHKPDKSRLNKYVRDFRHSEKPKVSAYAFVDGTKNCTIVMTNDGCRINGYSEKWL